MTPEQSDKNLRPALNPAAGDGECKTVAELAPLMLKYLLEANAKARAGGRDNSSGITVDTRDERDN